MSNIGSIDAIVSERLWFVKFRSKLIRNVDDTQPNFLFLPFYRWHGKIK